MNKTTIMAAILATATFTSGAMAGSLADPVVEPIVIIDEATSSSSGTALVVALAILFTLPALD